MSHAIVSYCSYPFDGLSLRENHWKRGGVEYLILNFYLPRGHVKSNIQSIGDIISFRINDTYFPHDVRGHRAGVTLPRSMCVDLFFFAIFLQIFPSFSSFVSHFLFFIAHLSHIFVLALLGHLDKQGFQKQTRSKLIFRTQSFKFFRHMKAAGVFPCV